MASTATAFVVVAGFAACGEGEEGGAATSAPKPTMERPDGEYEEVLFDLRDAAAAGKIYDAYGFAQYMPTGQRAAIDAFCFVNERLLDSGQVERFAEPGNAARLIDAQARLEFDHGAPGGISAKEMVTARRAIRKLRSIVDLEAIDEELSRGYVSGCYNRRS
ncbi:MAG TPA: hypothetical protein VFU04_02410 [Solirubrobacterales bacterium]|nr:hypothetical protein [Solirubrobacterales bacterium]